MRSGVEERKKKIKTKRRKKGGGERPEVADFVRNYEIPREGLRRRSSRISKAQLIVVAAVPAYEYANTPRPGRFRFVSRTHMRLLQSRPSIDRGNDGGLKNE